MKPTLIESLSRALGPVAQDDAPREPGGLPPFRLCLHSVLSFDGYEVLHVSGTSAHGTKIKVEELGVRSSLDRSHRRPVRLDFSRREIHAAVGVHEYTLLSVAEFLGLH